MENVKLQLPEGTLHYPIYKAAVENGVFEKQGLNVTLDFTPFTAWVQSLTNDAANVGMMSLLPYIDNYLQGEDLVTFGFDGCFQGINGLYTRADSDYSSLADLTGQRVGVWSWGSSTVQSFQAVFADQTDYRLRKDFKTTTAAPPALVGLLDNGEIDGAIDVSSLTIQMEAQSKYRNLVQLNNLWRKETGNTLPITAWWAHQDWYNQNTETAGALLRGARAATTNWRENTRSILKRYGERASITSQAQRDVVVNWASNKEVFHSSTDRSYVDSTWKFIELAQKYGFVDSVPSRGKILKQPL